MSIPAHMAEDSKKKTKPDKARHMHMAQASHEECRYSSILTRDFDYGDSSG